MTITKLGNHWQNPFWTCTKCHIRKALDEFHKKKRERNGHCGECKICTNKRAADWCLLFPDKKKARDKRNKEKPEGREARIARRKTWYLTNLERQQMRSREKKYGVTEEQYRNMLVEQNNQCGICSTEDTQNFDRLCIDHDHVTKKVRGLLCNNCNRALGLLKDNKDLLLKALIYLDKSNV